MPQVPRLAGAQVQQKIAQPAQGQQAPNFVAGAGDVGKAAAGLANTFGKIVQQERNRANKLRVREADGLMSAYENDSLYGQDGSGGLLSTKGKNALSIHDPALSEWGKKADEIEEGLANEEQRASFRDLRMMRKKGYSTNMKRHSAVQGEAYRDEVSQSYIKELGRSAVNNFADTDRIGQDIARQKGAILDYAEETGKSKGWARESAFAAESSTHMAVVNRRIDSDLVSQAEEYFDKNEKKLTPAHHKALSNLLERSGDDKAAQDLSDEIFAKSKNKSEAYNMAYKEEDPDKRRKALSNLDARYRRLKDGNRVLMTEKFESFYSVLSNNGGNMKDIPTSQIEQLTVTQQRGLETRAKQIRDNNLPQKNTKTWYDVTHMDKLDFKEISLWDPKYRNNIEATQWAALNKMQNDLRTGKDSGEKAFKGIETKNSIVNGGLKYLEIPTGKNADADDIERANKFRSAMDDEYVSQSKAKGRELDNKELRQIRDDMTVNVITERDIFSPNETARRFELEVGDISRADMRTVVSYLVSKGFSNPTDKQILDQFTRLSERRNK